MSVSHARMYACVLSYANIRYIGDDAKNQIIRLMQNPNHTPISSLLHKCALYGVCFGVGFFFFGVCSPNAPYFFIIYFSVFYPDWTLNMFFPPNIRHYKGFTFHFQCFSHQAFGRAKFDWISSNQQLVSTCDSQVIEEHWP